MTHEEFCRKANAMIQDITNEREYSRLLSVIERYWNAEMEIRQLRHENIMDGINTCENELNRLNELMNHAAMPESLMASLIEQKQATVDELEELRAML